MTKTTPNIRSLAEIENRFDLFKASEAYKWLQGKVLAILGLDHPITTSEWSREFMSKAWSNTEYMGWWEEMRTEAHKAGLSESVVELTCLVEDLDLGSIVKVPSWPTVTVVASTNDREFLGCLLYWSMRVGAELDLNIRVAFLEGDQERGISVQPWSIPEPERPLDLSTMPGREQALSVRIEFPPSIPFEEIVDFARRSRQAGRKVLRRLGYDMSIRERITEEPDLYSVTVVSSTGDPEFMERLVCSARDVGTEQDLEIKVAYLYGDDAQWNAESPETSIGTAGTLELDARPPRETALSVQLCFRPSITSAVISALVPRAREAGRELLRRLDYQVPKRERSSGKAELAGALQLHIQSLSKRQTGNILDDMLGAEIFDKLPDHKRRRLQDEIKSNRSRLRNRARRYE